MTLNATIHRDSKNSLSKPIPVRLLPDEMKKVEHYVNKDGRSRSSFMRRMFILGLEQHERDHPIEQ
jgi:hypothetical protein